jgi:hypothetical protein
MLRIVTGPLRKGFPDEFRDVVDDVCQDSG